MAKSSKLVATKRGRVLLVRRRRDKLWMFPGGRKRANETEKECLRREIKEELPKFKMGRVKLWKEVRKTNPRSGRKMNDAIFIAEKASGELKIGDKREIDKAARHPTDANVALHQGQALPVGMTERSDAAATARERERDVKARDQVRRRNRLCKKTDRAGLHRAGADAFVEKSRDEDEGRAIASHAHLGQQLKTVHRRHLHIRDHTRCFVQIGRVQKLVR
jgi:ADP-ribose pyrophosphatase YjhB (NUDIX family)